MAAIGVTGDIHGNLTALRAVLEDCGKINEWWCAGDIVGYGPDPEECVESVRALDAVTVAGNHDLGSIRKIELDHFNQAAKIACRWTYVALGESSINHLSGLENKRELKGGVLLLHGGPVEPTWEYVVSAERALVNFSYFSGDICFHGHSHVPVVFRMRKGTGLENDISAVECIEPCYGREIELEDGYRYLVNVGSVGQPRDGDPRACYVLYDPLSGFIRYHRVEYPVQGVQQRIIDAGLPENLAARLAIGR